MHVAPSIPPSQADSSLLSTDLGDVAVDPRREPPASLDPDPLARWAWVREVVRDAAPGLPVDQVRRIEAALRPDRRMVSRHGELDPVTVIALLWFQHDHDLPLSGLPDPQTLAVLRQRVPGLDRALTRRLAPPGVLVPDSASPAQRYLHYRGAILRLGGLVDETHRAINVLVIAHAELRVGPSGLVVRSTPNTLRSFVTVSLWAEREGGDDDGALLGLTARERPGLVQPVVLRDGHRVPTLDTGQHACVLDRDSERLRARRALIPSFPTDPAALPLQAPTLALDGPDVPPEARAHTDPERLTWPWFLEELRASRRERARRERWTGFRLTVLDASQLQPLR